MEKKKNHPLIQNKKIARLAGVCRMWCEKSPAETHGFLTYFGVDWNQNSTDAIKKEEA